MPSRLSIECPAPGCGHRYEDRDRAPLIATVSSHVVEVNRRQQSTTSCPKCGQVVELGLLMLDDDGLWRISRFAGHADDVTVMRPPGGKVSYGPPPEREATGKAIGLSSAELRIRSRALLVMEGRALNVALGVQRDALELALHEGVLDEGQAAEARAWLDRGRC